MLPQQHQLQQHQAQTMAFGAHNETTQTSIPHHHQHHHQLQQQHQQQQQQQQHSQQGVYNQLRPHVLATTTTTAAVGVQMSQQQQQPISVIHSPMQAQNHHLYQNQNHHHQHHDQAQQQHIHNLQQQQQQQPMKCEFDEHQHEQQRQHQQQYRQQHDHIRDHLSLLLQSTQQTQELIGNSGQLQEDLIIRTQDRGKLLSKISIQEANQDVIGVEKTKAELSSREMILRRIGSELKEKRGRIFTELKDIFNQMSVIQNTVLYEHLPRWHQDQQLVNNGAKTENNALDQIQVWVEMLTDITWRLRNQLKAFNFHVRSLGNFNLEELNLLGLNVNRSLENLVLSTFVVEKQPPQVMKTNTRFTSTVRFLSGARLNVQMINPTVKATILSESNARAIIQRHQEIIRASWPSYLENPSPQESSEVQTQQQQASGIMSPTQNQNVSSPYSNQHQQQATNVSSSQPPPSSLQAIHHQQQFFQQQHPPQQQQQFHVQQQQLSPSTIQQHQYHPQQHQVQSPEMASSAAASATPFYQQKILNMNEFDPSGEILNSSNILEYQETTNQLVCNFRNMQLKKIKRTEKKGTESVMDEKFILLFHAEFRIAEPYLADNSSCSISWAKQGDLSFHIMAFSLPVVVIVHGNQEPHAWATVTWHNAFARPDEVLYQVPDKVYWRDLGQVLSDKFRDSAGKGLSAQNLEYLASKVCRNFVDSSQVMVTWNQFAKEPLPEKSFTFWEWFHSILKLTKEHLRDLWNADRIYGFVGKKGCVDLLLGSAFHEPTPAGTFLLRYSETELGGITIAWVSSSSQLDPNSPIQMLQRRSPTCSSPNVLMHLQPFVSKDLNTRTLADRIRDLDDLVYLYPDILKDDAFRSYYSPLNDTAQSTNGYVKPMLVQTLVTNYPKNLTTSSMDFAVTPATPNSFSQSSPDGIY